MGLPLLCCCNGGRDCCEDGGGCGAAIVLEKRGDWCVAHVVLGARKSRTGYCSMRCMRLRGIDRGECERSVEDMPGSCTYCTNKMKARCYCWSKYGGWKQLMDAIRCAHHSSHASRTHFQTRNGPSAASVSPSFGLPTFLFPPLSPLNLSPICSPYPQRYRFRLHRRLHPLQDTAKLCPITFTMSADDIDDELFALAGGDEDADIEEGEA